MSTDLKTVFQPKVVTDLGFDWEITEKFSFGVNIQNIFNVLPEWKYEALNSAGTALLGDAAAVKSQTNLITFNNRYHILSYDGSHFSQLGTVLAANLTVRF